MAARPDTLAELTNNELLRRYRFDRRGIEYLVGLLRADLESPTARHNSLSVSEKVLITLRFLATGEIQLNDGDLHHVAQSTVSKVVTAVINALASPAIIRQFIAFPTTPADLDLQVQEFGGVAGFPKVVGVIDGTQVRIIAPSAEEEVFVNRKGFHSINVQVIFNACDKLVDIVARWPGSTHDSKILHNSGVKELFERGVVPAGYHLLGDSGYPSRRWLLSPYLHPQPGPQSSYNRAHKVTRAKVERGIGQLKRRFGILHGEIRTTPEKACRIITACGVLHNICKMQQIPLPNANDDNDDDDGGQPANLHDQAAPDVGLRYRDYIAMTYF